MCGVVGIISHKPVASEIYDSLIHLQHRGQDAAGITTYNNRFHTKKGVGLVRDIFDTNNMARLQGNVGIGHTRYPTIGSYSSEDAQPVWTGVPYGIAMAHNGNLVNYDEVMKALMEKDHRHLNATVDVEILLHVFAGALERVTSYNQKKHSFFDCICVAVEEVFQRISGSYSVIGMIIDKGMIVFRDPHGIRPLARAERKHTNGVDYLFASETSMFYSLGYQSTGAVLPGEVIYVDNNGQLHSRRLSTNKDFTPCAFEYVYFARPDTMMNDVSVFRARLRMGQNLADAWKSKYPNVLPDVVIPAPSTANTAALSVAHELGIRYSEGLYKNPFIGRTFIMPGQAQRKRSVKYKLVPQETEIRGKDIMIVDDSIVRGNTSHEIVRMLRDFGAKKIYFISACPPITHPCFYGVDIPSPSELIASQYSVKEIGEHIGVDILLYQEIDGLVEAIMRKGDHNITRPCLACMDGKYVTGNVDESKFKALEAQRNKHQNS
jgi:amidophosphoribosyltransferase